MAEPAFERIEHQQTSRWGVGGIRERFTHHFRQRANPDEPRHEPAECARFEHRVAGRVVLSLKRRCHGASRGVLDQAIHERCWQRASIDEIQPVPPAERPRCGELGPHGRRRRPPRRGVEQHDRTIRPSVMTSRRIDDRQRRLRKRHPARDRREERGSGAKVPRRVAPVLGTDDGTDIDRNAVARCEAVAELDGAGGAASRQSDRERSGDHAAH